MDPRHVPPGASVRISPASFPPTAAMVAALRRYVAAEPRVEAVYVMALAVDEGPPNDVVAVDLQSGAARGGVLDRLATALEPVAPRGVPLDLSVLSEQSRLAALRVCAPIGAGGRVETLAARAGHDPGAAGELASALLEAQLFLPALGEQAAGAQPEPRTLNPGDPVRFPVSRIGGQDAIAVFSSWWALLHADPPFGDQLVGRGRAVLGNWPDGVGLALDVGSLHAALLGADQVSVLRQAAQAGDGDAGPS